ncbi:restriction endonuclease subunit S [Flavobacterium columnare]|uniref:restriction endonuclease subunit S n=1 Tax=Flavobacterium columnare TaxID=996 RepID=UPI002D1FC526|nr:restriction endonuclease subunit S [Flavobacterium columnare]MEB3800472.1 restriction endonuclease subunit S [Flavobacterium columnare]
MNKQFISEAHAKKLENFTCLPGDILVGTLGEPNLRACKFPFNIEKGINKADCLQIRPNNKVAIDIYLTYLLNHEGMLFLSKNFIKGQTRSRISGSKLAKIKIPIPPLKLQNEFKSIMDKIDLLKSKLLNNELDSLFQSLIQKAFNGQLNFNVDLELDALISEIDLQKKDNNIKEIAGDIAYLQRLIDKLNTQDFKEKEMYDKAKIVAFQLMNESEDKRRVSQEYDEKTKNIKLSLV